MKKYVICDYAVANWGKTDTLKELFYLLQTSHHLIKQKEFGNDLWGVFELKTVLGTKKIVVSTIGDPNPSQPKCLEMAKMEKPDIIVCAARTKGETVMNVYNILPDFEKIWFQNFHFDNVSNSFLPSANKISAKAIYEMLLNLS